MNSFQKHKERSPSSSSVSAETEKESTITFDNDGGKTATSSMPKAKDNITFGKRFMLKGSFRNVRRVSENTFREIIH